ncbi:MAG: hypothetical protein ICV64_07410 [Thermoleophilia bacterium]|nr:hypothetical protein [Thermoleophilia bacterium]
MATLAGRAGASPIERSHDARFAGRLRRLAAVSVPGLGSIGLLAHTTLETGMLLVASLYAGWALMPTLLLLGVARPLLRYALALPSALVGVPLLVICVRHLPADGLAAAGWLAVTAGILLGGLLGLWFWFRLLPVPAALDDPFARGRWTLVALHVALVVGGLLAVALAALV